MELRSPEEFTAAAVACGIGPSPLYPRSPHLQFVGDDNVMRVWKIPDDSTRVVDLARALLSAVGRWAEIWMQPTTCWAGLYALDYEPGEPWYAALRDHGIPHAFTGSVRFTPADRETVEAVLAGEMQTGQQMLCDMRIVLRPGDVFLYVEHHGVVWVHTRGMERMKRFRREMESLGFPRLEEPPDATFKPLSLEEEG